MFVKTFCFICSGLMLAAALPAADRPNIVWIVGEDMGVELACYGDRYAHTPNLDKLASQGARFTRAFTHAPVCAPSRSGLITGMYPTTMGTHHMRSELLKPPPTFTRYLREAGYYVAWPGKTDFNFKVPEDAFDSTKDWVKGVPRQPFFTYINFNDSHESQIRAAPERFATITARLKAEERHDPAKARLPPYYPNAPEVRRDVANYYDLVTAVDYRVGGVLDELDRQRVADNTIVVFFGDHGWGMPRGKRWLYDSGIHVPLLVRWLGKIKPGSVREELVSFIDLAPTMLSLAGVKVPTAMQGQVFLGPNALPERRYIFATRDRMDETYDRIRAVRDRQFKYIRNFHPDLPYAQRIQYAELMPTLRAWRELNAADKLAGPQKLFFARTKPKEELYDLNLDPHEIENLADSSGHRKKLEELRGALDKWIEETDDLGAIRETDLIQRGLVADKLKEYEQRQRPLPERLKL